MEQCSPINNIGFCRRKVDMNELIKINTDATGRRAVSGRELHEFLEVQTDYTSHRQ